MSTSDKLTQIANNVAAVYAAGVEEGRSQASVNLGNISITTFDFEDTDFDNMNGTKDVDHSLGTIPVSMYITANKTITQMIEEGLTIPEGKTGYTLAANGFSDQTINSYMRYNGTTLSVSSTTASDPNSTPRLIYEITDTHVRIKPPTSAYPWPNKNITTFTLICIGNTEETTE